MRYKSSFRSVLLSAVSALIVPGTQVASAQDTATSSGVESVVVSGSRIVRDGYQAPTPVTVIGAADLQMDATVAIADSVNRLPQFSGTNTAASTTTQVSTGTAGLNLLDLRDLGEPRTLVLVDGIRTVGSSLTFPNAVDINTIPSALVTRVDVVTGGASAAYGSDALSGVVNFVLDHDFTGIKGNAQVGETTYGDNQTYKVSLTMGTPFANGRGHFLLSGEDDFTSGIQGNPRAWGQIGREVMVNPAYTATNGLPQNIIVNNVGLSNSAPGGLITSGPLKGTAFGPGGAPYQFNYGTLVAGNLMSGGDWQTSRIDQYADLLERSSIQNVFSRVSYDVSDNFHVYAQVQWSSSASSDGGLVPFFPGNLTATTDNVFLPASVKAQAVANNVASFSFGTTNNNRVEQDDNQRTMQRFVLGGSGAFGALNTNWTWDAFLQQSSERISISIPMDVNKTNLALGMDSVANPANGLPICRSTLANPTNGCVPYDPFGIGVNNQAAINYVTGTDFMFAVLTQDQMGVNLHGEPFSTWAGPVSLATGFEWRRESANGYVPNPADAASSFFNGNFHPTIGHYDVAEGYVETVVPLAKNAGWAEELDLNAAARVTGYSVSGVVNTWKVGLTYQPIDDLRFRSTYSRDIRAPTVGDLYQTGVAATETGRDDFNNNRPESDVLIKTGNLNLKPEKSSTFEVGAVLSPSFLPGFNASADYYEIGVINAISSGLSGQATIDECFQKNDATCTSIIRNAAGVITTIYSQPLNLLSQNQNGLDLEASYDISLSSINSDWGGTLAFRGLGTAVFKSPTTNAGVVTDAAGTLPLPKFKYNLSATYADDPYTVRLTARGESSVVYSNLFVTCTSACPASTITNPTYSENYVPSDLVFDLALTYGILKDTASDRDLEAYLTVTNLLDKDPPLAAADSAQFYRGLSEMTVYYDRIGRQIFAGFRFKM